MLLGAMSRKPKLTFSETLRIFPTAEQSVWLSTGKVRVYPSVKNTIFSFQDSTLLQKHAF